MNISKEKLEKIVYDYIKEVDDIENKCSKEVIQRIIDIFFNKVFNALRKEKFFRGNRKKINNKNNFIIEDSRTLNSGGVLERTVFKILSEKFYKQVAINRINDVFRRIHLSEKETFYQFSYYTLKKF